MHAYPSFPAASYKTQEIALATLDQIRGWWAVENIAAVNDFLDAIHHGVLGGCVSGPKWVWSRIDAMNLIVSHWEADILDDAELSTSLTGLLG
jgi:hypothetical protein